KQDAFLRIEAGGEIVRDNLNRVLCDSTGVGVVAGQGVPVGDEVEAIVGGIVLQPDPVLQCAEVMADVQLAGRPHAADYALLLCFLRRQSLLLGCPNGDGLKPAPTFAKTCRGALQPIASPKLTPRKDGLKPAPTSIAYDARPTFARVEENNVG